MFQKYREAGFAVIPSIEGHPVVKWKPYQETLPSIKEAAAWDKTYGTNCTYELICGKVSGVIALDIDTNDKDLIAKIETIAGKSPVRKFGSKGYTAFYSYNGEEGENWGGLVELLSDKHLTAIPPGLHRTTGKPYVWMNKADLLDGLVLPKLGAGFIAYMNAFYPKTVFEKKDYDYAHGVMDDIGLDDAADMLDFISPACDRNSWVRIAFALRSYFGDEARQLWHEWSSKSIDQYNPRDADMTWKSASSSGGVKIGTLIWEAKQGGYIKRIEKEVRIETKIKVKEKEKKPLIVGGLVGEISDWITETAIKPQPMLSLAAALSFVSMLNGNRVKSKFGLHPNIYVMALAPSGCGKEYPQMCIELLSRACGLDKHLMGEPTSGSGLLTGLRKASSNGLLVIDEMGRFLGNVSMKSSGSHMKEIVDYMIKIYSKSGGTFRGKQYANDKESPLMVFENPYLSIYGSTVKERFAAACTSAEVLDGFLNRWLIFRVDSNVDESFSPNYACVPDKLVKRIKEHMKNEEIKTVEFEREAFIKFKEIKKAFSEKASTVGYPFDALYTRLASHLEKLCMLICNGSVITINDLNSANNIVQQSHLHVMEFAANISNNQYEADLITILNVIKSTSGITTSELITRTRHINRTIRNDILNQLVESEHIDFTKHGKGKKWFPCKL